MRSGVLRLPQKLAQAAERAGRREQLDRGLVGRHDRAIVGRPRSSAAGTASRRRAPAADRRPAPRMWRSRICVSWWTNSGGTSTPSRNSATYAASIDGAAASRAAKAQPDPRNSRARRHRQWRASSVAATAARGAASSRRAARARRRRTPRSARAPGAAASCAGIRRSASAGPSAPTVEQPIAAGRARSQARAHTRRVQPPSIAFLRSACAGLSPSQIRVSALLNASPGMTPLSAPLRPIFVASSTKSSVTTSFSFTSLKPS